MSTFTKSLIGKIFIGIFIGYLMCENAMSSNSDSETELEKILNKYRGSLPCLEGKTPGEIVLFLRKFSPDGEKVGVEKLENQIKEILDKKEKVRLLITGFPFKSLNPKKVISPGDIDLGELLGLTTFDHICKEIEKNCGLKAELTIVPDAFRVALFLGVVGYRQKFIKLVKTLAPETVKVLELQDIIKEKFNKDYDEMKISEELKDIIVDVDPEEFLGFCKREIDCDFYKNRIIKDKKAEVLETVKTQKAFIALSDDLKKKMETMTYDQVINFLQTQTQVDGCQKIISSLQSQYGQGKTHLLAFARLLSKVDSEETKQVGMYLEKIMDKEEYKKYIRLSVTLTNKDLSKRVPIAPVYLSYNGHPWHNAPFVIGRRVILQSKESGGEKPVIKKETYKGIDIQWIE